EQARRPGPRPGGPHSHQRSTVGAHRGSGGGAHAQRPPGGDAPARSPGEDRGPGGGRTAGWAVGNPGGRRRERRRGSRRRTPGGGRDGRRPQPEAAPSGLRRRGARGAHLQRQGVRPPPADRRPRERRGRLRAHHGGASTPGGSRGRPGDRAGHRPGHHRRRHAPRRPAGEHPPRPAQPAGGGGGLPAAAGGVRRHTRGARRPHRPESLAGHQHHPAVEAAGEGADARGRGRHLRGARSGSAGAPGGRGPGRPRHPHRCRGDVGPGHRGGGRDGCGGAPHRQASRPQHLGARGGGARFPAVRPVRDDGQDPDRPLEGQDRRRVRFRRRPAAHHRRDGAGDHRTSV
ncbi:MAG: Chromosome (plasmid) partitioning protein ParB, partial [uncultured Blastococcus sp.]